jgi:hypothetical protein
MPDNELVNIGDQFTGLPIEMLISKPLSAASKSQVQLARSVAEFIETVGLVPSRDEKGEIIKDKTEARTVSFKYDEITTDNNLLKREISVPLLAIVQVPNLMIDDVAITFDMEVKSSTSSKQTDDMAAQLDAHAHMDWGIFSMDVNVHASVSSHKENQRSSDNSAKYHVEIHAKQASTPEGLMRVLDMMNQNVRPLTKEVTKLPDPPNTPSNNTPKL